MAWNALIVRDYSTLIDIGRHRLVEQCQAAHELFRSVPPVDFGRVGPPALWSCASDKIAEVERLLGTQKP
jgi:hypothetical protein